MYDSKSRKGALLVAGLELEDLLHPKGSYPNPGKEIGAEDRQALLELTCSVLYEMLQEYHDAN